jgi:hypothetical protein
MKKQVYYMIAAALTLGFGACTNNELETESEVAQQDGHVTITARIANAASTRVSIDGLDLSWNEDDEIGIVYSQDGKYTLEPFKYVTGEGGVAEFKSENDLSDKTQVGYAIYPYNDIYSSYVPDYNMIGIIFACKENASSQISMPLLGTGDVVSNEFTFNTLGALLAITVKNLPAGYTKAKLDTNNGDLYLTGGAYIYTDKGFYKISSMSQGSPTSITYSFENSSATDQTFYFPIPAQDAIGSYSYKGTTFTLSGDDMTSVGFTIGSNFKPERNKKYTKVIVFDEDGNRSTDQFTLANANLEVSNSASVDITNGTYDPTIVIPQNKKEGNKETVTLTLNGSKTSSSPSTIDIEEGKAVEGKAAAANVDINLESNTTILNVNLPSSEVTLSGNDYNELECLYVKGAKTMTVNRNVKSFFYISSSKKLVVNNTVNLLSVEGAVDEIEVNGSVTDEFAIEGASNETKVTFGSESSVYKLLVKGTITLTVVNSSSESIEVTWDEDTGKKVTAVQKGDTTTLKFVDGVLIEE